MTLPPTMSSNSTLSPDSPVLAVRPAPGGISIVLLQIAHRALALAIWTVAARIALFIFMEKPAKALRLVIPVAGLLAMLALACAGAAWMGQRKTEAPEAPGVIRASLVVLAIVLAWLALSIPFPQFNP